MGNHEFACEVCGENKFGLMGCKELYHSLKELRAAKKRRVANGWMTTAIDKAIAAKIDYNRRALGTAHKGGK